MNRYGVVESAGDSMEARYDAFRKASVVAKTYTEKAAKAEKRQEALAEEARELRDAAETAANSAAVAAGQIAVQKEAAGPGTRRGPEHLGRAGRQAAEGARADRATGRSKAARAKARRGGQGRAAPKGRQGAARNAKAPRRTTSRPTNDGNSIRQLDRGRLRRPGPARQRLPAGTRHRRPARGRLRQGAARQALPLGRRGPDSFDCSGLTMMAWRAGREVAAALVGRAVPAEHADLRGQLRKGDLVFWGGSPGLDPPRGDVHRQRADHPRSAHRPARPDQQHVLLGAPGLLRASLTRGDSFRHHRAASLFTLR